MNKKFKDNTLDEIYGNANTNAPKPNGDRDPDWKSILLTIAITAIGWGVLMKHANANAAKLNIQLKKELDLFKEEQARRMEAQTKAIAQKIEESAPPKKEEPPKV